MYLAHDVREELTYVQKLLQASQVLFLVTRGACKISIAINLRRMFGAKARDKRLCNTLVLCVLVWTVAAVLAVLVKCPSEHLAPAKNEHLCSGEVSDCQQTASCGSNNCHRLCVGILLLALMFSLKSAPWDFAHTPRAVCK